SPRRTGRSTRPAGERGCSARGPFFRLRPVRPQLIARCGPPNPIALAASFHCLVIALTRLMWDLDEPGRGVLNEELGQQDGRAGVLFTLASHRCEHATRAGEIRPDTFGVGRRQGAGLGWFE